MPISTEGRVGGPWFSYWDHERCSENEWASHSPLFSGITLWFTILFMGILCKLALEEWFLQQKKKKKVWKPQDWTVSKFLLALKVYLWSWSVLLTTELMWNSITWQIFCVMYPLESQPGDTPRSGNALVSRKGFYTFASGFCSLSSAHRPAVINDNSPLLTISGTRGPTAVYLKGVNGAYSQSSI